MVPPRTAKVRYPLTKDGKSLLRAAALRKNLGSTELGARVGVTHATIEQIWADGSTGTEPTWSSHCIPALCHEVGLPLWAVVAGFDNEQRAVLAAMALVHDVAPDRYEKLVADFIEKVQDVCRASGWSPADNAVPAVEPAPAHRRPTR